MSRVINEKGKILCVSCGYNIDDIVTKMEETYEDERCPNCGAFLDHTPLISIKKLKKMQNPLQDYSKEIGADKIGFPPLWYLPEREDYAIEFAIEAIEEQLNRNAKMMDCDEAVALLDKFKINLFASEFISDEEAEMLYHTILNWKERADWYDCDNKRRRYA